MKDNIVYVKTENGIFKCYKSEQMNKPIYHPVNSNGFIDYNDVEKIVTIDDLFEENQELKKQQKEFIEWLEKMIKDLSKNEEYEIATTYEYILSKYKEIIGGKDE